MQNAPTTAENASESVPMAPQRPHFASHCYYESTQYTPPENKEEGVCIIRIQSDSGRHFAAKWGHGDTAESCLALDLETCAEPKIGRKGRITATGDALDPFKGEIRLVTLAGPDGEISQFDLRRTPTLPPEILTVLVSEELVIHNAAFELRFLATKFGLWPQRVFCTLTASRLLEPLKSVPHALGPKFLGNSFVA
jgi:hypothetical protein